MTTTSSTPWNKTTCLATVISLKKYHSSRPLALKGIRFEISSVFVASQYAGLTPIKATFPHILPRAQKPMLTRSCHKCTPKALVTLRAEVSSTARKVLTNEVDYNKSTTDFNRFHFNGFTCYLTLFSKCFSSFPHGTCSLSVSCLYLALDEIYHPFWAAFPNNPTLRKHPV